MTMLKTKWFKIQLPISLKTTYEGLLANPYEPNSGNGFEGIEYSEGIIQAKFIEKIITNEKIIDPFGNENILESTRYSIFEFSIILLFQDYYLVKIISPPRSIKNFVNTLYKILGFGLFISPVAFDLKKLLFSVQELLNPSSLKVTKVTINGLILSEYSSAKLEMKSSRHAYNDLLTNFPNKKFTLENIKISLRLDGIDGVIEASKAGSIYFTNQYEIKILSLVEKLTSNL